MSVTSSFQTVRRMFGEIIHDQRRLAANIADTIEVIKAANPRPGSVVRTNTIDGDVRLDRVNRGRIGKGKTAISPPHCSG